MIKSGVKKEEYREIKKYWVRRLFKHYDIFYVLNDTCIECKHRIDVENIPCCGITNTYKYVCDINKFIWNDSYFNKFDKIVFKNGYAKDAPSVCVEFKGIRIGKPKIEWCADTIDFDEDNGYYEDCFIIELGNIVEE